MGIDPRALGLDCRAASVRPTPHVGLRRSPRTPRAADRRAALERGPENVVPLRPEDALPASGTSAAWAPAPPPVAPRRAPRTEAWSDPMTSLLGGERAQRSRRARRCPSSRGPSCSGWSPRRRRGGRRGNARWSPGSVPGRPTSGWWCSCPARGASGPRPWRPAWAACSRPCATTSRRWSRCEPERRRSGGCSRGEAAPSAREIARTDVEVPPLRLPSGLQVVDGPRWSTPVRRSDVPALVDGLGQTSVFALFDVGNDASDAAQASSAEPTRSSSSPDPARTAWTARGSPRSGWRTPTPTPSTRRSTSWSVPRDSALKDVVRRMRADDAGRSPDRGRAAGALARRGRCLRPGPGRLRRPGSR